MDSCLEKIATGSECFLGAAFEGISRVKEEKKEPSWKPGREVWSSNSFPVTQRPRGKGFILSLPVWGLALTLGRSWPSALILDTIYNFFNCIILGKSLFFSSYSFFFLRSNQSVDGFSCLTRFQLQGSRLTCGFETKSVNKKIKSKICSLLQVLNVHTSAYIFHLLKYIDVLCVFTHCGLWLLLQ